MHDDSTTGLRLAVGLTLLVLALEVAGGIWAHSLALLADAGHVATDVLALGLAWFAALQSRRPADPRRTYGYHRAGVLAALANAAVLLAVIGLIAYEAARRLIHPEPVAGGVVVGTALAAVAINGYVAHRLSHGRRDLNIRAALLHVVGDLGAGAGVLVAGLVILLTGWLPADPLTSLGICLLIAVSAVRIVREATHVLLEGTPAGLDLEAVKAMLLERPEVRSVHDLHAWTVSPEHPALSAHLVVDAQSLVDAEHLVRDLEAGLCRRFGIGHTTIQLEVCHPCAGDVGHGAADHNHPHVRVP
jgi:cobalt-zinc-cadmium efflux system protein